MEFDTLSMYGFSIEYPSSWRIELDSKSKREKGTVAFKSPEKIAIFLSWGPLEDAKKRYASSREQAEGSVERMRGTGGVKDVEVLEMKSLEVNSHEATFTHTRIVMERPLFVRIKPLRQKARSLHLHCQESERYFVLYLVAKEEETDKYAEVFDHMMKSIKCHK